MMDVCVCHPNESVVTRCWECCRGICEVCVRQGKRDLCMDCRQSQRRGRIAKMVALAVLGSCLVAGASWRFIREAKLASYGEQAPRIVELQERLQREPCDASAAVELGDLLMDAGMSREVGPMAQAFKTRCGRQEQLLWKEYAAAKEIGNWDRAIAVSTDLIEHDPADKDYWWWRGIVYEQREELDKALADYKQTLAIRPDINSIPFNVADVYERMKRPCDAALAIEQHAYWHPRSRSDQGVQLRLQRLYREGHCENIARGSAELHFAPDGRTLLASVAVNGKRGQFVVDTGASLVVLTSEFAARAGVSTGPGIGPLIRIGTANGAALAQLTRLDTMAIQGATATGVEAAVMDELPGDIDGLLGLSFLTRFDFQLDAEEGRFYLEARRR